jgi:hypothetical protein
MNQHDNDGGTRTTLYWQKEPITAVLPELTSIWKRLGFDNIKTAEAVVATATIFGITSYFIAWTFNASLYASLGVDIDESGVSQLSALSRLAILANAVIILGLMYCALMSIIIAGGIKGFLQDFSRMPEFSNSSKIHFRTCYRLAFVISCVCFVLSLLLTSAIATGGAGLSLGGTLLLHEAIFVVAVFAVSARFIFSQKNKRAVRPLMLFQNITPVGLILLLLITFSVIFLPLASQAGGAVAKVIKSGESFGDVGGFLPNFPCVTVSWVASAKPPKPVSKQKHYILISQPNGVFVITSKRTGVLRVNSQNVLLSDSSIRSCTK